MALVAACLLFVSSFTRFRPKPPVQYNIDLQSALSALDDEIAQFYTRSISQSTVQLQDIQDRLSCLASRGSWRVTDSVETRREVMRQTRPHFPGRDSTPIREYVFSKNCFPSTISPLPSVESLCSQLQGKKIIFVGPETTYRLHISWLGALEKYERRSHACLGREFCTFHQICRTPVKVDEPFQTKPGNVKYPSDRALMSTHSAVLRYALSTSLYAGKDSRDPRYTVPDDQADVSTGIRMREVYWLAHARKSDVIVLNRGPIPAPSWTYDGTDTGNWTFVASITSPIDVAHAEPAQKIVAAALNVTIGRFLPELMQTLEVIRQEPNIKSKLLIWHGSWYLRSSYLNGSDSRKLFFRPNDLWSLYYNAQVYMHNHLLQSLLPHYGIVFVPLTLPKLPTQDLDSSTTGARDNALHRAFENALRMVIVSAMSIVFRE
ncbi:hypothetical protein K435DRAFT_865347 [Dendrothele bispora CBS 962.96]|uniref:Uncharacterized protein n=1 Tax=Dendrothele bispora (strain CBS 962.96) TaxID=1314807 RepID=A0A4S8LJP1_DENBC|nr:hypothetical protein K435DRAFT_865347 [Dendrothele bispora CBS 962.96]